MVMNENDGGLWTGTALVKFYMVGSPPEPTLLGDSLYYASRLRAGNQNPPASVRRPVEDSIPSLFQGALKIIQAAVMHDQV